MKNKGFHLICFLVIASFTKANNNYYFIEGQWGYFEIPKVVSGRWWGAGINIAGKLTLVLENKYGEMDDIKILLATGAGDNSSDRYDALKWSNINLDVYSLSSDGVKLSIDNRGVDATVIPLGIKTNFIADDLVFKVKVIEGMEGKMMTLRDKLLHKEMILKAENDSYTFNITTDTSTQGDNRFELVIQNAKMQAIANDSSSHSAQVLLSPNPVVDQLMVALEKSAVSQTSTTSIRILDAAGKTLQLQQAAIGVKSIPIRLTSISKGILFVKVKNDKVNAIQKILKE